MENNAYRVQPKETAKGAVVFLHGLGDSGQGWSMVSRMIWMLEKKLNLISRVFSMKTPKIGFIGIKFNLSH